MKYMNINNLLILVLALGNGAMLMLHYSNRNKHQSHQPVVVGEPLPLNDLELMSGPDLSKDGRAMLFVFINADEKCGCLEDWHNWVAIATSQQDRVQVLGIFSGTDFEKFTQFTQGLSLPFPIYRDRSDKLRRTLRLPENTTSKVLVSPGGYVLYTDVYQDTPRDHDYFLKRATVHLKRLAY